MRYPFNNSYPVTSPFGWRVLGNVREFHDGADFGTPFNTPILASNPGKVTVCTFSSLWGNYIEITQDAEIMTRYAHLQAFNVSLGQNVKEGDLIGWAGSTGRSTGPHLHFGLAKRGVFVDPLPFLNNFNNNSMNNNQAWFDAIDASELDLITKENNKAAINQGNLAYAVGYLGSERFKNEVRLTNENLELSRKLEAAAQNNSSLTSLNEALKTENKKLEDKITELSGLLEEERAKNVRPEIAKKPEGLSIWQRSIFDALRNGTYGAGGAVAFFGVLESAGVTDLFGDFLVEGNFSQNSLVTLSLSGGMLLLGYMQELQKNQRKQNEKLELEKTK